MDDKVKQRVPPESAAQREPSSSTPAGTIAPLPFGIPLLDEFLLYTGLRKASELDPGTLSEKLQFPDACLSQPTSLAIVGQDGTGKSIFALHLAAMYLQLHEWRRRRGRPEQSADPHVFYLSSDFAFDSALRTWREFGLECPWLRHVPFTDPFEDEFRDAERQRVLKGGDAFRIHLRHCVPTEGALPVQEEVQSTEAAGPGAGETARNIAAPYPDGTRSVVSLVRRSAGAPAQVGFVDLNRYTTGDDWLFAVRLVSSLGRTHPTPNLLILDSVEGFETLVGEQNSFGERMSRRARIAQLMRAARSSWHIVLLVEEPEPGKRHPEEYITDTVLHLRRRSQGETVRRVLEIEKCRGRYFAGGEHPFEIRSGIGSSTGDWENPDDPYAAAHPALVKQGTFRDEPCAYVQVFASLNYLSHKFASRIGSASQALRVLSPDPSPPEQPPQMVVPFGIPYLDELLTQAHPAGSAQEGPGPDGDGQGSEPEPQRGLPGGTITSLVGDGGTRKEALVEQFLLHQFSELPALWALALRLAQAWLDRDVSATDVPTSFLDFILDQRTGDQLAKDGPGLPRCWEAIGKRLSTIRDRPLQREQLDAVAKEWWRLGPFKDINRSEGPLKARWDQRRHIEQGTEHDRQQQVLVLALALLGLSGGLLAPVVLVTTQDMMARKLVERLKERHWSALKEVTTAALKKAAPSWPQAGEADLLWQHLARILERFVVVRRIDNIDLTAQQLWQIVETCVQHGLELLGRPPEKRLELQPSDGAGCVRVVISDLRVIREVYPDVAADPLFLSVLVFRLRRLGITALLVHSAPARPDTRYEDGNPGLRSMVNLQILTWKVPFFGKERIAITVSPPMNGKDYGVIRELRSRSPDEAAPDSGTRLYVDPHFELYAGVEKGEPQPVPLQISLWNETKAFGEYARRENELMGRLFSHLPSGSVIEALNTRAYHALRDFTHLPDRTRLPYTHVLAVDGHWALTSGNSALRSQQQYLFGPLREADGTSRLNDVYQLYEPLCTAEGEARPIACRADAFEQHRSALPGQRRYAYRSRIAALRGSVDRVPFTWDFGFLVCDQAQWDRWSDLELGSWAPEALRTVGRVWQALHRLQVQESLVHEVIQRLPEAPAGAPVVPWRVFLAACRCIARAERQVLSRPHRALDLVSLTVGSLLCLMLEIWLSEVVQDAIRLRGVVRHVESLPPQQPLDAAQQQVLGDVKTWIQQVDKSVGELSTELLRGFDAAPSQGRQPGTPLLQFLAGSGLDRLEQRFQDANSRSSDGTLRERLPPAPPGVSPQEWTADWGAACLQARIKGGCALQLFKAWLLLKEAFDFGRYQAGGSHDSPVMDYLPQGDVVAVRHWYKTACDYFEMPSRDVSADAERRNKVPVRMPGHFTMRGDWFLAVAKGSRSYRLADMAMDLLTSRRANRTRLEMGIGLPTRDLLHGEALDHIRTGLGLVGSKSRLIVPYGKLLWLSGSDATPDNPKAESPLRPDAFYWLFRSGFQNYYRHDPLLLTWVSRLVAWTAAQQIHDTNEEPQSLPAFQVYDACSTGDVGQPEEKVPFVDFARRLDMLCSELSQSCVAKAR